MVEAVGLGDERMDALMRAQKTKLARYSRLNFGLSFFTVSTQIKAAFEVPNLENFAEEVIAGGAPVCGQCKCFLLKTYPVGYKINS